jgi:hypothetical protein
MIRITSLLASASLLALGACAVAPPPGPTVAALPGKGKTFEAFRQDDNYCRQYASEQTGNADPAQAATASAVGSAAVGTALGAATGALIGAAAGGAGVGAAIGAGAGLIGGNLSICAAGAIQARYDQSYSQCMFGQGDTVTQPQQTYAAGPSYGYPPPAYYGPAYVAPPPVVFGGPSVVIGGGYYRGGWYRGPYWR